MKNILPDGVWPTMITPFHPDGSLDIPSLIRLVDWYVGEGVAGLFAVCQSSEMFHLSLEEKVALTRATIDAAAGRVPVICSGHTGDSFEEQREELQAMAATDAAAVVLITNRLAGKEEGDSVFLRRLERLTAAVPAETMLGFYECPYPYKRLLSDTVLRETAAAGRFRFLKDTSCDSGLIRQRLDLLREAGFKLYNANSATLSLSLAYGASGYSGVMANFHPALYTELVSRQQREPGSGDRLQELLGPLSAIEDSWYPMSAKYYLQQLGVLESAYTRKHAGSELGENHRLILRQMKTLTDSWHTLTEES